MKRFKIKFGLLMIGILFSWMSVSAQVPSLNLPANGAYCTRNITTFSWSLFPNTQYYRLQVAEDQSFTNIFFDRNLGSSNSQVVNCPHKESVYYWRIWAVNGPDSTSSEIRMFVTKSEGPATLSPLDGATCIDRTQLFAWMPMQGTTEYNIEISQSPIFNSFVVDSNVSSNTFSFQLPSYNTTYYCRVGGYYNSGTITDCLSEWSDTLTITTRLAPPNTVYPTNKGFGVPIDSALTWQMTSGSTGFDLVFSPDPNFVNNVTSYQGLTTNSQTFSVPNHNTMYYWKVTSLNTNCTSEESSTYSFKTGYAKTDINTPTNNITCQPLNTMFTWDAVNQASKYRIQVSKDSSFVGDAVVFNVNNITSTSYTLQLPSALTEYYWRVRADDTLNYGRWSEIWKLTTSLYTPDLASPADAATEVSIGALLEWTSVNSTTRYWVQVSKDAQFTPSAIIVDNDTLTNNSLLVVLPDYNTNYWWRVSSTFNECWSGFSEAYNFKSQKGYPDLTYPANGSTDEQLQFQFLWNEVFNATSYDVQISLNPNFTTLFKIRNGVPTNNWGVNGLQPNSVHYWRVRSNNEFGTSPWSPAYSFTTVNKGVKIPTHISIENGRVKTEAPVQLVWSEVEGATKYHLQVAVGNDFDDEDSFIVNSSTLTSTSYTLTTLEPYTDYFWRVAAINDSGSSAFSSPWYFKTIALVPSDKATLEAPINGSTGNALINLNFKWSSVPRAEGYAFEISTDPTFVDAAQQFIYSPIVWSTFALISNFDDNIIYHWRVRGWNEAGDGPWSDVSNFRTIDYSSIDINKNIFDTKISPNPAGNTMKATLNLPESGLVEFNLVSSSGLVLSTVNKMLNSGNNEIELDLQTIPSGSYFLLIKLGNESELRQLNVIK